MVDCWIGLSQRLPSLLFNVPRFRNRREVGFRRLPTSTPYGSLEKPSWIHGVAFRCRMMFAHCISLGTSAMSEPSFVRSFAKGVTSELLRQDLLDIAAEYQRFPDERRDSSDNRNDEAGDLVSDQ